MIEKFLKSFYQDRIDDLQDEAYEHENLLDVMIPYADLMTLLLIFFVMFFIFSSLDEITAPSELLKEEITEMTKLDSISANEKIIQIPSEILFESGEAKLKSLNSLIQVAKEIKNDIDGQNWQIRVEGHTDNIPIHTEKFASNWELSSARAISVVRFFLQKNLFKADQLQAMGYGEHKPLVPNTSPENRKKNRRVEIRLTKTYK